MSPLFRRRRRVPSPPPVIKRMQELEILTARLIRAGFAGQYHAAFHGHGIEFSQVREYQPGDDIRTIDWNVTARSGVPHVKQFVEERDLGVVLCVDVSHSMDFGSVDRRKSDLAVELTAILTFAAMQNNDRVGLALFSDTVRQYVPPKRGRVHGQMIVRHALAAGRHTSGVARMDRLTTFLQRVLIKRTVVIILSDLLDGGALQPLQRLNAKHDVVALCIRDPREQRFPEQGIVRLVDLESGNRVIADLHRNRVSANALARDRVMFDSLRRFGIDALDISTALPYERALLQFFEGRVARPR